MPVQLLKRCFAFAVVLITSPVVQVLATESGPEQWEQAFPLSSLRASSNDTLPAKPDLAKSLSYRETGAAADQIDPLSKTATIRFAPKVSTIGDAAKAVLDPVGYELLSQGPNVSSLLAELLDSPLPLNQREFSHLRVSEMLRALAGVGHVLVIDHVHRKVTFDPVPRYNRIGQATQADVSPVASQYSDKGISDRLTQAIVIAPLSEPAPQKLRAEKPAGDFDTGQSVDGSGKHGSFADQIDRALQGSESSRQLANINASVITDEHFVRADVDALKLRVETERTLRRIAADFLVDKHEVIISDCSVDVPAQAQELHRKLIGSALVRLGVGVRHHQTHSCADSRPSVVLNGQITHLVALSVASS